MSALNVEHAATEASAEMTPAATVRGLVKTFGGRTVLGPVDLDIFPGEFVALLGPNGAGKSTLIKILDGVYTPDGGEVLVAGERGQEGSVGVVHQDLGLIDDLTILENLRLGQVPLRRRIGYLDRGAERRAAQDALDRFELTFNLDMLVAELAPSERALLAVARVAATKPRLIVLDETTSVLSSSDAASMIDVLRRQSPADMAFAMITHKLQEALDLATRVVVLRDGLKICDQNIPLPSLEDVTALLAPGRVAIPTVPVDGAEFEPEVVFEMKDVRCGEVGPINVTIRRGECVGITGQTGTALPTVAYLAAGTDAPASGTVTLASGARRAIVPPSREREGTLPHLTVRENVTLGNLGAWLRGPILSLQAERTSATEVTSSLGVVPADNRAMLGTLSGGNQQKVIFGRAIMSGADVLILCEPTRGVDIATRTQIYDLMQRLKSAGRALFVVASDPQDVLAVSDRVLVMRDGQVESEFDAREVTSTELASLV